jgi:hypothetical protein
MAKASTKKQRPTSRWHDGTTSIDDLAGSERLAHELVTNARHLAPSVERIMDAELTDTQRLHALTAFNESLGKAGDPNRDPRVAIDNALALG